MISTLYAFALLSYQARGSVGQASICVLVAWYTYTLESKRSGDVSQHCFRLYPESSSLTMRINNIARLYISNDLLKRANRENHRHRHASTLYEVLVALDFKQFTFLSFF